MGIRPGIRGVVRFSPERTAAALAVSVFLLVVAAGCGTKGAEHKPVALSKTGSPKAPAPASPSKDARRAADHRVASAEPTNRVHLINKGCVQLEPHWTTVRVGQSLEWRSELKTPVTIHVSPGAFDKTEYIVRAGASVSTGPARGRGPYSIWTEPAACQGIARGVQGSGPGVTVAEVVQH